MSRKKVVPILVAGSLILAAAGGGAFSVFHFMPHTVSVATSPDGTWSVAVIATPHLFSGSYDISVEVRDAAGNPTGTGFVIDLTDLDSAKAKHAIHFLDNTTATVGNRTVKKETYFRQ